MDVDVIRRGVVIKRVAMQMEDEGEGVPSFSSDAAQAADSSVSDPTAENVRIGVRRYTNDPVGQCRISRKADSTYAAVCPRPF